jgi:predicted Zn-dependent peptidase
VDYAVEILPPGLRLVHAQMKGTRSVTIAVFVAVGSRHESDRNAGISHLTEHMLFKGTSTRPQRGAISAAIDGVGGIQNASTDKETTVYWVKVAADQVDLGMDVLADMIRRSLIRSGDVRVETNVILEELSMAADDPQDWVHVLADEVMWPDQPLGREIAGTRESVAGIRRGHVMTHLGSYYGANNTVVSIAGGIDRRTARKLTAECFDGWQPVGAPAPLAAATVVHDGDHFRGAEKPTEQINLCLVYPGMARRHPDRWALDILLTILGGGGSSRLFQSLRERAGLVYETHAYSVHYTDAGSVVLFFGTDPLKLDRALDGMVREVSRVRRRGVSDEELNRAKRYYAGRMWLGMEDSSSVASWFGAQESLHHEVLSPAQAVEAVELVTRDDVKRIARLYLDPSLARIAAVGPGADPRLLERIA